MKNTKAPLTFIWGDQAGEIFEELVFSYLSDSPCTGLKLAAADFYQVFADGKFISYGPERTAAGYCKPRFISLDGAHEIKIKTVSYRVPCYTCDFQPPYFAAVLFCGDKIVAESSDFACHIPTARRRDVPRYSYQRGFTEVYDFTRENSIPVGIHAVDTLPIIIDGVGDTCRYHCAEFHKQRSTPSVPFDEVLDVWWSTRPFCVAPAGGFDPVKDVADKLASGSYLEELYTLETLSTGFIRLEIEAEEESEIICAFEEILPNGKWLYRRSNNNDFVVLTVPAGKRTFLTSEPYAFKFLKVCSRGKVKVHPSIILLQNDNADCVKLSGDAHLEKIFEAAKATFCQNALDIFTDCPGRERAGWLCDSYFTAQAERLFTGKSDIEREFLHNFIIGTFDEIAENMLPDCFPAQHHDHAFIPNWAMWFVIELGEYLDRTGDRSFIDEAKSTVDGLLKYFKGYENEFGLLENLDGWVFVEWSKANEYVNGINFPSNMLYARMLDTISLLYHEPILERRAREVREHIMRLSFDGELFHDNAVRVDGVPVRCEEHITETCQYYALFCGMNVGEEYIERIRDNFGPKRTDAYPNVHKSNMFIGTYLRLFWLCRMGEYERVLDESVDYFSYMAEKTGTLWENDTPSASCNHGFASVIAVLLLKCFSGYKTIENFKPVFEFVPEKKRGITVEFDYGIPEKTIIKL